MPKKPPAAAASAARRPPGIARRDIAVAAAVAVVQTVAALAAPAGDGRTPDALGWTLLTASAFALVLLRRAPWLAVLAVLALVAPYHSLDFAHTAAVPSALIALYFMAAAGPPLRSFLTIGVIIGIMSVIMLGRGNQHALAEMLRTSGWLFVCVLIGESVRIHRNYVGAIVERAERAERTREEEAARRVAQERLRIARDLHDLLAHSITLIGVQTSVAAHVLVADPERLDREAVAKALDGISDTCRDARAELRTTLEVLRGDESEAHGPLPGLSGLADLARAARGAGAHVELTVRDSALAAAPPPAVGAAAYRIVQEAFTNAVRHAGPEVRIEAAVSAEHGLLRICVRDDGAGRENPDGAGPGAGDSGDGAGRTGTAPAPADRTPERGGFGLVGMRERARSVGGTVEAGPAPPGFQVLARIPLASAVPVAPAPREVPT
ncbi:sensor histidine kinase [Streptomyces boncukensis]|uniref:histidine kinase n=1 Tax=Streptomyces boncukensis TaxID=2711219 RepID=A0A6G4WR28_9ACTN|nr:histidine kinase [Streptomyces boncukensis]NGO67655.1 sensor histidine kinase [Streptomyces boncukensis]